MYWRKLGLLYCSSAQHPKLISHAANPLPVLLKDDTYRIYFSGRDKQNRSSVGAVDIDILQQKIIQTHKDPFFTHGPDNSFYADGVSIGNCYEVNGKNYMLFMGWQNPKDQHWRGDIGRLIINPDYSLSLDSEIPLLTIDSVDPISLSYPWVEQTNQGYQMWYGSTLSWDAGNGEMLHVIHAAQSNDGHRWERQGLAVPYELGRAQAFSRPTVMGNQMWFSYRNGIGTPYRIGYALKQETWQLQLDSAGIDVSASGWDSEMIEYPFVFEHKNRWYMLYNGNGYGKTGFGLAVLNHD